MRYLAATTAIFLSWIVACKPPCPALENVVLDEDSLRPGAASKLVQKLGEPTWHWEVELRNLNASAFEGQTGVAIRVAKQRAESSVGADLKVDVFVWEDRCRGEVREAIVAVVDPSSGTLISLESSTALGERPLVIVRSHS